MDIASNREEHLGALSLASMLVSTAMNNIQYMSIKSHSTVMVITLVVLSV